jgi:hypothetical protein
MEKSTWWKTGLTLGGKALESPRTWRKEDALTGYSV